MFIIPSDPHPDALPLLASFKSTFGTVPPHFELLATLNPVRFEMFVREIAYLAGHERIVPDFFACLRLFIAAREGFNYCLRFNTGLLRAKGYTQEQIRRIREDLSDMPLDARHKLLASKALKAIYDPDRFSVEDLGELEEAGWNRADCYDAIDHAAFLFKNARIIKAFSRDS
jgi:hypothetical protein